jgi:hypothetical protein
MTEKFTVTVTLTGPLTNLVKDAGEEFPNIRTEEAIAKYVEKHLGQLAKEDVGITDASVLVGRGAASSWSRRHVN